MPFFSVIIPVYKAEGTLAQCVDSVLCQSFSDYELILVDDGSPDGCPALCDQYAGEDRRVRVIHKSNGGASSARNAGMRAARGEFLLFLDSDDYWCESKGLEIIRAALARWDVDVLVYGVKTVDAQTGQAFGQPHYPPELNEMDTPSALMKLLERNTLLTSFCEIAIRRSLIEENELYADERLIIAEDGEWVMRVMCCQPRYAFINDTIYCTPRGTADIFSGTLWDRLEAMADFLEGYLVKKYPSDAIRQAVLGLGAYHYTLLCAKAAAGEKCAQRRVLLQRLKGMREYWRYAREHKACLAARVHRMAGFGVTTALLGLYMKR